MLFLQFLFFIYFIYVKTELALSSYALDTGEWPEGTLDNDKTVENLMDRWFIDIKDAKCKPFEYRGTKGNFNNFPSQKLCERHLLAELTQVEKLQGCQQTPSSENEHHGACTGNSSKVDKYYFNKDDGTCALFKYNGCGGTFNRYDSVDECKAYCLNSKNGNVESNKLSEKLTGDDATLYTLPNYLDCHLKPDVKTHEPTTKVIALIDQKKCVYSSVDTVLGRGYFDTLRECVAKCFPYYNDSTNSNESTLKRKVEACDKENPEQIAITGDTDNSVIRYYYKRSESKCKRFETAPNPNHTNSAVFDKTKNSFPTLDLCHSYCGTITILPEKTCQVQKRGEKSNSNGYRVKRYYYMEADSGRTKKCKTFYYGGIDGNTNNFKTLDECKNICGKNMRPDSEIEDDQKETTSTQN